VNQDIQRLLAAGVGMAAAVRIMLEQGVDWRAAGAVYEEDFHKDKARRERKAVRKIDSGGSPTVATEPRPLLHGLRKAGSDGGTLAAPGPRNRAPVPRP